MNFEFSEEQQMLRDMSRKFLSEQCTTSRVRAVLEGASSYDQPLWKEIADMGWLGTAVDEAYGGVGMGYLELCVIAEELGRHLAPVPFSSSVYLATEALLLAGSEQQKSEWLPKLTGGELIGTLAMTENLGPLRSNLVQSQVKNGKITGSKMPVIDGDIADLCVVLAKEDAGNSLFLVPLDQREVSNSVLATLDPTRSQAKLVFNGADAERIGQAGQGFALLERILDRAAVLVGFEQLGSAHATLEIGVDQAKNNYAFGRPIGSFQAIKHKLADMFVSTELARSNCYYGAWALSNDAPELGVAAAGARISAIQANYQNTKESLQVHGGMGFTWEADCHLYYRRAKLLSLMLGGERVWKNKLINRLQAAQSAVSVTNKRDAA